MKLAILQNGDTPQIESSAMMLELAGYTVKICGPALRQELKAAGCDTVLSVQDMYALGYDELDPSIKEATPADMDRCDLFLEIKVRNVEKILNRWPKLEGRIAWLRVNGAQPEICPKGGDEVHLICPVITACLWYALDPTKMAESYRKMAAKKFGDRPASHPLTSYKDAPAGKDWGGMAYTFWPPYPRHEEYDRIDRTGLSYASTKPYGPPYCLAHSVKAWGYGRIMDECVTMGVRCYGNNSPHGQILHRDVAAVAATARCLVHLKSVDCPGWALYEAILSGCPVVTGRLLNSRMLAYELLEDGVTCLEFGVPASEEFGRGDMADSQCVLEIREALERLKTPEENLRIGEAARHRLNDLMWTEERDGESFRKFLRKHFG